MRRESRAERHEYFAAPGYATTLASPARHDLTSCHVMTTPATFSWRRLTCLSVIVTRDDGDIFAGGLRVRPGEEKWGNLAGGCVAAEEGALVVGRGQARHEGRSRPMQAAAVAHAAHARRHEAGGGAEGGVV